MGCFMIKKTNKCKGFILKTGVLLIHVRTLCSFSKERCF